MITQERIDELQDYFWSETNEEWTQEWRDELTAEESALVDEWDSDYDKGIHNICKRIVELDEKRKAERKDGESQ